MYIFLDEKLMIFRIDGFAFRFHGPSSKLQSLRAIINLPKTTRFHIFSQARSGPITMYNITDDYISTTTWCEF